MYIHTRPYWATKKRMNHSHFRHIEMNLKNIMWGLRIPKSRHRAQIHLHKVQNRKMELIWDGICRDTIKEESQ